MRGSGGGTERVKLSRLKVVCIGGVLASSDQLESLFSSAHRLSLRIIPLDFTFAVGVQNLNLTDIFVGELGQTLSSQLVSIYLILCFSLFSDLVWVTDR